MTFDGPYGSAIPGTAVVSYQYVTYYVATSDPTEYKALLALDASGNGAWEVTAVAGIPPEWKVPLCTRGPAATVWSTADWGSKSAALQYCDGSFAPGIWPKPTSDCKATWMDWPVPSVPSGFISALEIAAISPTDVWAAEQTGSSASGILMAHFNGSTWATQPGPELGSRQVALNGMAAVATNDIWAAGSSSDSSASAQALIAHYDGKSWSVVPSPSLTAVTSELNGITRVPNQNELWAVGQFSTTGKTTTLIEHYDGASWAVVSSLNLGSSSSLSSVSADTANDVWAVGAYTDGTLRQTLLEHYDGTRWSIVPSPNYGTAGNSLNGIVAASPTSVWAVGESGVGSGGTQGLIEHYDGKNWALADHSQLADVLYSVAASSPNDVWAVGRYQHSDADYSHTLLEHFDGGNWTVIPTPYIELANAVFTSVATFPQTGRLWFVGTVNNSVEDRPARFSRPLIQSLTWRC